MKIVFYVKKSNKCPVKDFIEKLQPKDRAKVLACLKSVEELGFNCPRVQFRQIKERLWEIKIRTASAEFRIFYFCIRADTLVLLHAYQKQSQEAPKKEIQIAEQRMLEVKTYEDNIT